jgi:chromosome segregation ATPase
MSIEGAEYDIEIWASKYNIMKGNYEESIRKRMKLADENERLKYELQKVENTELCLQEAIRERDILRLTLKRWEARVENIRSRETLTEKLNRMSKRRDAVQEVVDELRTQNERERTRVHELIIERDAGRKIIKEYMEALKELEDGNKKLQLSLEDERWQQYFRERDAAKICGMRCVSF